MKKNPKNTLVVIACIETYRMIYAKVGSARAEDSCHFTYRTAIFFNHHWSISSMIFKNTQKSVF